MNEALLEDRAPGEDEAPAKRRSRWWRQPSPPEPAPSRHGQPWTKDEERLLRKHYTKHGSKYTAAVLGRNVNAVQERALKLGIPGFEVRPWTEIEKRYLQNKYGKFTAAQIARTLKRTEQSVRAQIHKMKLGSYNPQEWNESEIEFLRANHGTMSNTRIATSLGRSVNSVQVKAGRLGLCTPPHKLTDADVAFIVKHMGQESFTEIANRIGASVHTVAKVAARHGYRDRPTSRPWTPEDDEQLRALYGTMSRGDVARTLNRTLVAVAMRAGEMGLTRKHRPREKMRPWTPADDEQLRSLYGLSSYKEIAEKMDRTVNAIAARAKALDLTRESAIGGSRRLWSSEEEEQLRALWSIVSASEIASKLGRSSGSVARHAAKLGLGSPTWSGAVEVV